MNVGAMRCPRCGETGSAHHLHSSLYSPSALVAIGGPTLALLFDRSRKLEFRCEKCGAVFAKHSLRSRFFQVFWIGFFVAVGAAFIIIVTQVMLH
jgi:hypothetical protein